MTLLQIPKNHQYTSVHTLNVSEYTYPVHHFQSRMNFETSKIQLHISEKKIVISDRMPIKVSDIAMFLGVISAIAIYFFSIVGVIYAVVFGLGYIVFRYFAWIIWKRIEIDHDSKKLTISNMLLDKVRNTKVLTNKFDLSNLTLYEFEQSGMKRGMIQYKNHKKNDLMLLTHPSDIDAIKYRLMSKNVNKEN